MSRCATQKIKLSSALPAGCEIYVNLLADRLLAVQMQTLVNGVKSEFQAIGNP